jgi:LysR family glycine cleavage system transcriptional activator
MYPAFVDLPPLNALRAFEATARHLSFTRAAEELHVTQTAISHQVRQLEGYLGKTLFLREARRIRLTSDGRAWADALADVFTRLHDANRRLRQKVAARPVVAVSTIPSLAARWLVPRFGRFLAANPEIDLRIQAAEHLVDFAVEPVDVGIRYGMGRYPGLFVEKLASDALIVVCSPAVKKKLHAIDDLRKQVLLHDDDPGAWGRFFVLHPVRGVDAGRGPVIDDSSMLVEAAVRGQGVALARWSLAFDDIQAGRLVRCFPRVEPMPVARAYYVVCPRNRANEPHVAAFRAWLRAEAQATLIGP